jgi:hypothetical protein
MLDPSGLEGLVSACVTMGIQGALTSMAISAPFRALTAVYQLKAGMELKDVALELFGGLLFDAVIGAVLQGGGYAIIRSFGSNMVKLRTIGQTISGFRGMRFASSLWNLPFRTRGLAIESKILGRAASFLGNKINNFPVIDDYVLRAGRGIATSIKSMDLSAKTYQTSSAILSKLNQYAKSLQIFTKATRQGITIGGREYPVAEKVLVIAFEEGAATAEQATAIVKFFREATTKFPDIKVVLEFIP